MTESHDSRCGKSKCGRTIVLPERYEQVTYVKGSGFQGCDAYDRKYHKSVVVEDYEEPDVKDYKHDGFVVSDSEEILYMDSSEPEYGDDYDSDESENDSDEYDSENDSEWNIVCFIVS